MGLAVSASLCLDLFILETNPTVEFQISNHEMRRHGTVGHHQPPLARQRQINPLNNFHFLLLLIIIFIYLYIFFFGRE